MSDWPGCHGVRLGGALEGWGRTAGTPITEATIGLGDIDEPTVGPLWRHRGVVDCLLVERRLHRVDTDRYVLSGNRGPRVSVDLASHDVVVSDGPGFLQRQLVTAFALPLLLHQHKTLVLHGAALERDGEAILVCGVSGVGKSSAMVTLTDAGWAPLSEDACAISIGDDRAIVWPGPPWVRVTHDEPGPAGATVVERGADKTAWSIADRLAVAPATIRRIVLLEAPGGDSVSESPVSPGDAIGALARHGVWLGDREQRGAALFESLTALVPRVEVTRLQIPRVDDWRDRLRNQLDHALCA